MYDVIIVGAGPAGCSCALSLYRHGSQVLLVDKAIFPRDKICGDALSVDVVNQLPLISDNLLEKFLEVPGKVSSSGVKIIAPRGDSIDIPFLYQGQNHHGFILSRFLFDHFLLNQVKATGKVDIKEGCEVTRITRGKDSISVHTDAQGCFTARIVVGADGAQSVVRKLGGPVSISRSHHSAGLRVYYEGVTGFHSRNFIELFFITEALPGYLWVFPMSEGRANVGIGMLSSVVAKRKINLKKVLEKALKQHPALNTRFENATPLESVKGFGLPLGSERRSISGDRYLLLGDAAGLIDPFSGEGIGNAMRSGRVAAGHILKCFEQNNFSVAFNTDYDREIYRRMGHEFKVSHTLQKLARYPWLMNWIVKKAGTNAVLQKFLVDALADVNQKKQLSNPWFYYKLLFS